MPSRQGRVSGPSLALPAPAGTGPRRRFEPPVGGHQDLPAGGHEEGARAITEGDRIREALRREPDASWLCGWSPLDTWIVVGVEICHLCVPSFSRIGSMGVEVRATTTVLTAFRTTVSPNKIPPPGPPAAIAAQVAAIGRLVCN